jgi:thiosulfate dehydrogenase [quinone] large subunit
MRTLRGVVRHIPRAHAQAHAAGKSGGRYARSQGVVASRVTTSRTRTNVALAGLQLVIGYQWLVSGVDKILLGSFPAQMGHLLAGQIGSGKLPGYFAASLRTLVVPNAPAFGYAIMLGETLAGLGLIAAGLLAFTRPLAEARLAGRPWRAFALADRLVTGLSPLAAAGAGLLGLSYYLLDGAPTLWLTPSLAYGGAIAPGMVVALACLVLVAAQVVRPRPSR